jgi:hypothetical protein
MSPTVGLILGLIALVVLAIALATVTHSGLHCIDLTTSC